MSFRLTDREVERIRRTRGLELGVSFAGLGGREVVVWYGEDCLGRPFTQKTLWTYPS